MSRKHPSFAQLIDYIEGEAKLKSRRYSIFHNTYSRDSERLKADFLENARHLRARKNGVYLYHEVISITRSASLGEDQQKAILQNITKEYLGARGKHNMAYAVLHEDTENLHFHIVMSANAVGERERKRLSKTEFAEIQNHLEAWVLREYPDLEQKAVFHKNQTQEERAEREAKRQHLSDKGEQMKRRGAKTEQRDHVQERLTDIFETATDPRHFADLMEKAGFKLYQRGKSHGITDREGTKYRIDRLGLGEAWRALDAKMNSYFHAQKAGQEPPHQDRQAQERTADQWRTTDQANPQGTATDPPHDAKSAQEAEIEKRLEEITRIRTEKAEREARRQANKSRQSGDFDR